jgi:hypothetical protein
MTIPPYIPVPSIWKPREPARVRAARKVRQCAQDVTPYRPEMEQIFWEAADGLTGVANRTEWEAWVIDAEAAPITERDLATKQLVGDAQYAVAKVESAIEALDADTGPLSERINAAWTDGLRQFGRDTIPRSWPEVRETYESIRNRVAKSGHLLDQFIAAMAVTDMVALANEIRHLQHQITQRTRPNIGPMHWVGRI